MKFGKWLAVVLAVCTLCSATALAAYETLRYGDEGSDVRRMQEALTQLGYDTGGIDGIWETSPGRPWKVPRKI